MESSSATPTTTPARTILRTALSLNEATTPPNSLKRPIDNEKPSNFLRSILPESAGRKRKRSIAFRFNPSEQDMENYDMESVRAIRSNDIKTLRSLLDEGKSFDACNRNGETLLHLACRRGNLETVKFLILEANVRVDVRDDMGRTVLHDVCWRPSSPSTEMMDCLIRVVSPEFLLSEDVRGHTCFDYCRKTHWQEWNGFLRERSFLLRRRACLVQAICCPLE